MGNGGSQRDCLLEAFEQGVARARDHVVRAYASPGDWSARVRQALTALLGLLDDEPALARLLFLDSTNGSARVAKRRAELVGEMVAALESGVAQQHGAAQQSDASRPHRAAARAESVFDVAGMVGAAVSILERRVHSEPDAPLLELVNPLMAMLVFPHHGHRASADELAEPDGVSIYGLRFAA